MNPAIPLRILHAESSHNWGGQEHRTLEEVRWLRRHGHSAWIACDPRSETFRRAGKEFCVPVRMRRSVDPLASRMLKRFCLEQRVDIVHTHSSRDSWVCYPLHLARVPVVRSRQITNPIKPSLDRSFIYRHGCSRILATADCIRRNLVAHTRVAPGRIEVIGEGVDVCRFNPSVDGGDVRREFGIGKGEVVFGLVAMVRPEKGHRQFIEAALRVSEQLGDRVRFLIVGEGVGGREYEMECRAMLEARLGGMARRPVIMTGFRSDMPQVMAAIDVLAVPSLADAQTLVIPQAYATGRPVIASRVGGLPEVVKHRKTGLLVEPDDVPSLAAAMTDLAENEMARVQMGREALGVARAEMCFDGKMGQCVEMYRRLAGRGREAVPVVRKAVAARAVRAKRLRNVARGMRSAGAYAVMLFALLFVFSRNFTHSVSRVQERAVAVEVSNSVPGGILVLDGDVDGDDSQETLSYEELAPMKYAVSDDRIIG